jgi:chitodextrinase
VVRVNGGMHSRALPDARQRDAGYRVVIDHLLVGYSEEAGSAEAGSSLQALDGSGGSSTQAVCGSGNSDWDQVQCYRLSDPGRVDRSRPVAMIIGGSGARCTAFRVGSGNRMLSNNACIADQADLTASEIWFNYQADDCFTVVASSVTKVNASRLLATSDALGYSLFEVDDLDRIAGFGWLGLETRQAVLDEEIYIPHHPAGTLKTLSIDSDLNTGGVCRVDGTGGSQLSYYCDTWAGSEGAPVMAASSNRVLALHTTEACPNRGTKMSLIWPEIAGYFGGVVPEGDDVEGNQAPTASMAGTVCDRMTCRFDGRSSSDSDGSIVSYLWDLGDGSTRNQAEFLHEYATPGDYTVRLTVEDDGGATGTTTATVTAWGGNSNPNLPPVANFSYSCNGLNCSFDAGSSSDTDGSITSYAWDFGDGETAQGTSQSAAHRYAGGGTYNVRLTIWDDDGATDTHTVATDAHGVSEEVIFSGSFENPSN